MAAPMVTGAAALIYSARTDLSLQDIKTAILSTVHKLAPLKGKTATGGMLDVSAAIKWTRINSCNYSRIIPDPLS